MTISPEQFLSQPTDPDEDEIPEISQPTDPLASIAASLGLIASVVARQDRQEREEDDQRALLEVLDREHAELEALHDKKQALIEEVLAVCKPSTSKLANRIREVLEPPVTAVPEPQSVPQPPTVEHPAHPAHEADVEEWRAYARSKGYAGPDIDTANKSQIRTMLGVEQPSGGA